MKYPKAGSSHVSHSHPYAVPASVPADVPAAVPASVSASVPAAVPTEFAAFAALVAVDAELLVAVPDESAVSVAVDAELPVAAEIATRLVNLAAKTFLVVTGKKNENLEEEVRKELRDRKCKVEIYWTFEGPVEGFYGILKKLLWESKGSFERVEKAPVYVMLDLSTQRVKLEN